MDDFSTINSDDAITEDEIGFMFNVWKAYAKTKGYYQPFVVVWVVDGDPDLTVTIPIYNHN